MAGDTVARRGWRRKSLDLAARSGKSEGKRQATWGMSDERSRKMGNDLISIAGDVAYWGGIAVAAFILVKGTFFTVPQQHRGLVSRFGKYTGSERTPGLNVKIPLIDKVDQRVSAALQEIESHLSVKTKDEQFIKQPVAIQFEVVDAAKYYYDTTNPNEQVENIVSAAVRKFSNEKDFNELYSDRDEVSADVIRTVAEDIADYGVVLRRVVMDEPQPDDNTKAAYNDVRASERRKDAAKNNAEAERIMAVANAQADKERNELMGQGIKSFRKSIAESYIETRKALIDAGVDSEAADRFMEEAMKMDTLRDVGQQGNVIVMAMDQNASGQVIPQVMAAVKASENSGGTAEKPVTKPVVETTMEDTPTVEAHKP